MSSKTSQHFMLDTNIVSYLIKGENPVLRKHLLRVSMSCLFLSVITEAEILYGLEKKPHAKVLHKIVHEFLSRVEVLPWDSEVSKFYAALRVQTEARGTPLGNLDLLIAAHSLAAGTVLVTADGAFRHVKNLKVVDWTKA